MQIDYLADHEQFVDLLVRWHFQEWSYLRPGESLEERTARLRSACRKRGIPTVFVGFAGDELLGSAMLVENDMVGRYEVSPWVAGVFVRPDRRRQGLGAALVRRVCDEAWSLGVEKLYLYTPVSESFYRELGWSVRERTNYRGALVVVMTLDKPHQWVGQLSSAVTAAVNSPATQIKSDSDNQNNV